MKVLIFGLCVLALAIAAPSHLAHTNMEEEDLVQLSDSMLSSEDFWTGSHPYLAAFIQKDSDSGSSNYNGIQIQNSVKQAVKDLYANASVTGYVSNGKLVLGVNSTVASLGGHYSDLVVAIENSSLLTGGYLSKIGIVAKNSNIYSMSVNGSADVVAKNSQYTDLIVNSTLKLFVTNCSLNLMVLNSHVFVGALNSNILISNASSTIKVIAWKNSTVTYVPSPTDDPVRTSALYKSNGVEARKFELFQLPSIYSNFNDEKTMAVQQAWQKLEKMVGEQSLTSLPQ